MAFNDNPTVNHMHDEFHEGMQVIAENVKNLHSLLKTPHPEDLLWRQQLTNEFRQVSEFYTDWLR